MRQKLAKQLRQLTKTITEEGTVDVAYITPKMNKTTINTGVVDDNGLPIITTFSYTGTIRLDPKCRRAIYKSLKKTQKSLK